MNSPYFKTSTWRLIVKNCLTLLRRSNSLWFKVKIYDLNLILILNRKTDDVSRKEIYEVIELIDAHVKLDEEEERY